LGGRNLLAYVAIATLIPCIAGSALPAGQTHVAAVAPSSPPIILASNGSLYELVVRNMSTYYALIHQNKVILAGTISGHPALAILRIRGRSASGRVALLPKLDGALFSAYVAGTHVLSVGYVALNGSFGGLILTLSGNGANASTYVSPYPMYFRDAVMVGGRIVAAAAVAVGGAYYAGVAVINGSAGVVAFLNPRVVGIKGFSVKALVRVRPWGVLCYGTAALRRGRLYVIVAAKSGGVLKTFRLAGVGKVFNVIPYHLSGFDELVIEGYPASSITFPSLRAAELPVSTKYFLVSPNGSITPLDSSFRKLPKLGRVFSVRMVPSSLSSEFTSASTVAKARRAYVVVRIVNASLIQVKPKPASPHPAATHALREGSVSRPAVTRVPASGFSRASAIRRLNYVELGVGCALVLIAYLLRKLLS